MRVGAQPALGRRAVELEQHVVERALVEAACRPIAGAISPLTCATALRTPLPEVARLVAVAQFERLALAGRARPRARRPGPRAAAGPDVHFHRGVAARVENFAPVNAA